MVIQEKNIDMQLQPAHSDRRSHSLNVSFRLLFPCLAVITVICANSAQAGTVSGSLQKWAPVVVDFAGPAASETDDAPNPFLDYRLTVTFTSPDGRQINVPGFFAGNGSGGGNGNVWRVRFAADEVGQWQYQASMKSGTNVAISTDANAGQAWSLPDASGGFQIAPQLADAPGFERFGRLEYIGEHYLKFNDGPYFIKSGTDSPENFLGYAGIDGTVDHGGSQFLHNYASHQNDSRDDDPLFSNSSTGVDSRGITGALNYLSDQGVNSIYFLPMNLGGDGQETYPFVAANKNRFNKTHYDVSKLYQWNLVLAHAQRRGIALNIQLSETELQNERWLDEGKLGIERKLFFRELIARFGYLLAAKWNLGEENDYPVSELRAQAGYLAELDWTNKPIAVHTQINNFRDYEELVGDPLFTATSIQYDPGLANEFVETWRTRSANSGNPWVIDMDENTGGVSATNAAIRRKQILYDVLFSGGNIEWYFGYHPLPLGGDLTAGNFRLRESTWVFMRHARTFMESQLPFWRMQPADALLTGEANAYGGAQVFAAPGEIYAVYLPDASGNPSLNLSAGSGSFSQQWFDPRTGQFVGDSKTIVGGQTVSLGSPPSQSSNDWVVLVKSHNAPALPDFAQIDAAAINTAPALGEPTTEDAGAEGATTEEINADETASNEATPEEVDTINNANEGSTGNNDGEESTTADSSNAPPVFLDPGELPAAIPGANYSLTLTATDADGVAPVITADALPPGMAFSQVADGVATLTWLVPADAKDSVSFDVIAIDVDDDTLRAVQNIVVTILPGTTEPETDNNESNATDETETDAGSTDSGNDVLGIVVADSTDSGSTDTGTTDTGATDTGATDTGATDTGATDTGTTDSGATDTGTTDSGTTDSGTTDTGATDTGATDTGTTDTGTTDTGATDAGTSDAGTSDTGTSDAGTSDAGTSDTGATDTGATDTGTTDTGATDTGATDTGTTDTGTTDTGATDTGATDTGTTDTGATDTGTTDSNNTDAGNSGAESTDSNPTTTDDTQESNTTPDNAVLADPVLGDAPPEIIVPANTEVTVGQSLQLTVVPVDAEGIVPALRMESIPEGARFSDNGNGSRDFHWTPGAADVGSNTFRFIATDAGENPHVVQQTAVVTVVDNTSAANSADVVRAPVNFRPVFLPLSNQEVRVGDTIEFAVRPVDPDGTVPILHVESPPQGSRFYDNGDGTRTFSWTANEDNIGSMMLKFTATDVDNVEVTTVTEIELTVLPE